MEANKVDAYLAANSNRFPSAQVMAIRSRLLAIPDEKEVVLHSVSLSDPTVVLILSIFLGGYGVDRFMIGDTALGVIKLLTCGGGGIWTIIDWFLIYDATKEKNAQKLLSIV